MMHGYSTVQEKKMHNDKYVFKLGFEMGVELKKKKTIKEPIMLSMLCSSNI